MKDINEFRTLITNVYAHYGQEVSEFTLSVWFEACKNYEFDQISKALSAHAMDPETGQFCPKVADVVKKLSGTPTDRSHMAWSKAYEAITRAGPWKDVVFDDSAIHAVIEGLGGWPKFCSVTMEELSYLQHRFCEGYKAFYRNPGYEYPKVLKGQRSSDESYLEKGLPVPKPTVIGNIEQARIVYSNGGKNLLGLINGSLTA